MTIYDPPSELIVVSYIWNDRGASGGVQKVFLSMTEARRHLAAIIDKGTYRNDRPVQALRLVDGNWEPMVVEMPKPLTLRPNDGSDQ